jgi:hypothetical protein
MAQAFWNAAKILTLGENRNMNIQEIILYILFAAAVIYIGRRSWRAMTRKDCGGGCASCGGIDLDAIEQKIKEARH